MKTKVLVALFLIGLTMIVLDLAKVCKAILEGAVGIGPGWSIVVGIIVLFASIIAAIRLNPAK